ncbi:hypothetical protein BJ138DRAFT_1118323, partial [Hygrophoropsis aurantiaca]
MRPRPCPRVKGQEPQDYIDKFQPSFPHARITPTPGGPSTVTPADEDERLLDEIVAQDPDEHLDDTTSGAVLHRGSASPAENCAHTPAMSCSKLPNSPGTEWSSSLPPPSPPAPSSSPEKAHRQSAHNSPSDSDSSRYKSPMTSPIRPDDDNPPPNPANLSDNRWGPDKPAYTDDSGSGSDGTDWSKNERDARCAKVFNHPDYVASNGRPARHLDDAWDKQHQPSRTRSIRTRSNRKL